MSNDRTIQNFMKPACCVKPGDQIIMKYRPLVIMDVVDVEDADDDYNVKIRFRNIAIGQNERIYKASQFLEDKYTIERKGA